MWKSFALLFVGFTGGWEQNLEVLQGSKPRSSSWKDKKKNKKQGGPEARMTEDKIELKFAEKHAPAFK